MKVCIRFLQDTDIFNLIFPVTDFTVSTDLPKMHFFCFVFGFKCFLKYSEVDGAKSCANSDRETKK